METTFAKWLREHGEVHSAYAIKRGLNHKSVAKLAGVGREPYEITRLNLNFVLKVAQETGIPIDTLVEDAARAARAPVAPRSYTKKGDNGGKFSNG